MTRIKLEVMTDEQLVEQFVAITLEQDQAILYDDNARYNRLSYLLEALEAELKNRGGDQRALLLPLYDHRNLWVRLSAVKSSLALAPEEGRRVLQAIRESKKQPYAGEAGMTLRALDKGIFKPT